MARTKCLKVYVPDCPAAWQNTTNFYAVLVGFHAEGSVQKTSTGGVPNKKIWWNFPQNMHYGKPEGSP